jgi:hypothetical protein
VFAYLEWRATEDVLGAPGAGDVCVHAAGIRVGARRLLVIGGPGSGKSTLAAYLGMLGGRSWGDDIVRFTLGTEQFSAFPRSWKVDDNTLRSLELSNAVRSGLADGMLLASGTWYVSPAALRRDWADEPGRPDAVVILDRASHGRPAGLERMSDGEAAVRVGTALLSAGAGHGPVWSAFMDRILEALRDVTAWRASGGPPAALAHAVASAAGT